MTEDDSLNPTPSDLPGDPAAEPVSPTQEPMDPLPEDDVDPEMPDPTETDE